jgi:hypothetical protein
MFPDSSPDTRRRYGENFAKRHPVAAATKRQPFVLKRAQEDEERGAAEAAAMYRAEAEGIRRGLLAASRCQICGRELTDPRSVEIGIGPDCVQKFGGRKGWLASHGIGEEPAPPPEYFLDVVPETPDDSLDDREAQPRFDDDEDLAADPMPPSPDGYEADRKVFVEEILDNISEPLGLPALCGRCENPATGADGLCDGCRLDDLRYRTVATSDCQECGHEIALVKPDAASKSAREWRHVKSDGNTSREAGGPLPGRIHWAKPVRKIQPGPAPTSEGVDIGGLLTRKYGLRPDGNVGTTVRPEYEMGDEAVPEERAWPG